MIPQRLLVRGDFQPDLEEALVRSVEDRRGDDAFTPVLLAVPHPLLARHLSLLVSRALGGWMGIEIMTLSRLAFEIAGPLLALEDRRRLTPGMRDLLVRRMLAADLRRDGALYPLRDSRGLPDLVLSTFHDLSQANLSADDVTRAAGAMEGAAGSEGDRGHAGAGKARELGELWGAYRRLLTEQGLFDATDAFAATARHVRDRALPGAPAFLLYGFHRLTPIERLLVGALAERHAAAVFMPHRDEPAFAAGDGTLAWLRNEGFTEEDVPSPPAAAAGTSAGPPADDGARNADGPSALAGVRAALFRSRAGETEEGARASLNPRLHERKDDSLLLLDAPSEEREIRECLRAALDQPTPDCGFLLRDPATYRPLLEEIASLSGIAIDGTAAGSASSPGDEGEARRTSSFARRPGIRAALLLLELRRRTSFSSGQARPSLGRRDVLRFATAAPLLPSLLEGPSGRVVAPGEWEPLTMDLGIRGGQDWLGRLEFERDRLRDRPGRDGRKADAVETLHRFITELRGAVDRLPARASWKSLTASLRAGLARLIAPAGGSAPFADLDEVLEELDVLDGISPATDLAEFAFFLERAVRRRDRMESPPRARGGIWAAELSQATGVPARIIVIPGLNEAGFPRRPRQDPLLLDRERRALNEALAATAAGEPRAVALRAEESAEEEILFRLALGSARRACLLSWTRLEAAPGWERERIPSSFVLETYRAATGEPASFEALGKWSLVHRVPLSGAPHHPPARAMEELEYELGALAAGGAPGEPEGEDALRAVLARRAGFIDQLRAQEARWHTRELTAHTGLVGVRRGLPSARPDAPMSPSRLENYARCPQRYFLSYEVGLHEREDPEQRAELDPRDRGTLYHRILRSFLEGAVRHGFLPWRNERLAECETFLEAVTEAELRRFTREHPTGPRLFWNVEREEIRDDLTRFLRQQFRDEGGFLPAFFELRFGTGVPLDEGERPQPAPAPDAPFEVRIGDVSLPLRGKIDRVDLSSDGRHARIVDYKTGKVTLRGPDPFDGGRALQLPLYALAAEAILPRRAGAGPAPAPRPRSDVAVEEALYYGVRQRADHGRSFGPRGLPRATWTERIGQLEEIAGGFLHGIREGLFFPFPPGPDECKLCYFRRVCGPRMHELALALAHDPRTESMQRIRAQGEGEDS